MSKDNIDRVIRDWIKSKDELAKLELKVTKYRSQIEEYMKKKSVSTLQIDDSVVTLRNSSRSTVNKNDLPPDLWTKYSHKCEFTTLTCSKIKDKDDIWSIS